MTDPTLDAIMAPEKGIIAALRKVSEETGISVDELRGPCRRQPIVRYRQWAMWRARKDGASLSTIARYLHRDHSTISHGIRATEARLKEREIQ